MELSLSDTFVVGAAMPWGPWLNPLWMVALGAIAAFVAIIIVYLLLTVVCPKIAAIALITGKEALSQPLFYVLLSSGILLLLLFLYLPYNTFGEDVKMVKEEGLTLIMILSIALALWTASVSVANEIEGRTALTLLSKPVSRRSFIIGKFLGIAGPVAILFIILGAFFLASVSFKVAYDSKEMAMPLPKAAECAAEMWHILPGLVLAFFEAVVFIAISVAIATRLPMMPNLMICSSIYVLGHLVPAVAGTAQGTYGIVPFVGQVLATILPVLEYFNIQAAILKGTAVPWSYVATTGLYCALISTVALLLALLLFEDRDLA